MSDLRELYQEVIMDHNRSPRNCGPLEGASHKAEGFNPLCGDQLQLYLYVNDDSIIEKVRFEGKGCAISTASASIMTETLHGRSVDEANRYFQAFCALATGEKEEFDRGGRRAFLESLDLWARFLRISRETNIWTSF